MALADPQRTEALDPFDPLQLADQLTEEERMIQGAARSYAEGGDDPGLRRIAQEMLASHEARLAELRALAPGVSAAVR